ncbi:type I restriction endonuclease subunit R [Sphingobium aromaticivastans]|uniref:type I restriction endonuclease subunit R n=1 Tax=Sphingobium aromaticivastans TaxID=1778665 RepID=UPI003018C628
MTYPTGSTPSANRFNEGAVELAAMSWLDLIGWRVLPGDYLAPGGPMSARADYRQTVLEGQLRDALATLNPDATSSMVETAMRAVLAAPTQNLLANNRAFHELLTFGVPVELNENGESRTVRLRLIDQKQTDNNSFIAANQFVVQGERETIRPDIVLFVNGLPLAVLELKNPADENSTMERAHNQLQNYKTKAAELFRFNATLVISDGMDARIGSLTAGLDRFQPWRTVDGEKHDDFGRAELEVLIKGAFDPARLLDLAFDYTAFEMADGVVKSKKLAGYHQFHAVRRALASTVKAAGEGGHRKGGVVWHTQGSGKSLTMLFYVRQLQLAKKLKNPTIVVVTDRNDLDDQLYKTFIAHGSAIRGIPQSADTVAAVRELLKVDIGGLVFTTIQRFRGDDGEHPLLTNRSNVIVIADEAHRSQYGLNRRFVTRGDEVREEVGFAEYLRQALPNATFIGFTGTPIDEKDRSTSAVFGDVIDTYDMTQSVIDKATVPIHYSARLARLQLNLDEQQREELDALAEELTEGSDARAAEQLKARFSRFEEIVGSTERIATVAADIVAHFEERQVAMGGGKGMIVAISRQVAVALYDEIARLRPAWAGTDPVDDRNGVMKVVITGNNADPPHMQSHIRTKSRLEALADRFKNPQSGFDLVIVRDMWLTGFDAPSLHTLYIDKPMRGHGLMQAIARVNRVFGAKPGGLIVDYLGIGAELRAALAQYSARDREQIILNVDEAVRQLLTKVESALALLGKLNWRAFFDADPGNRLTILKQCLEEILSNDHRAEFIDLATQAEAVFAIVAGDERASVKRQEVALIVALRANLIKYTSGQGGRGRQAIEQEIRQLMSKAVMSDGILDVFKDAGLEQPDLAILSDDFLLEVKQTKQPNLAVETLRRLLQGNIKARERLNIVEARKLSERLDDVLTRYHNRAVDSLQVIDELLSLARDVSAAASRGNELGLEAEELAFYDALAENGSAKALMEHEQLRFLAQSLVKIIRSTVTVDWTQKESVRAKMRIEVRKLLARYGYPPDLQKAAVDLVLEQANAIAIDWAL